MKRLLLLDLDGTVVDTLGYIIECFRQAVAPCVKRLPTDAEIVATFGPAEVDCIAKLLRQFEPAVTQEQITDAAHRFHALYEAGYGTQAVLAYPHMIDIVHDVRKHGWATAIFTGKGKTSALATLEHLELLPYFDAIITSDDVTHPKPAPDGVLLACTQTQTTPQQTIFVGDNPADIIAGNTAGAFTIAALWGAFDRGETLAAHPSLACESPSDLRLHLQHVMIAG